MLLHLQTEPRPLNQDVLSIIRQKRWALCWSIVKLLKRVIVDMNQ